MPDIKNIDEATEYSRQHLNRGYALIVVDSEGSVYINPSEEAIQKGQKKKGLKMFQVFPEVKEQPKIQKVKENE